MPTRTAEAEWKGDLAAGSGTVALAGGAYEGPYSFASRFGDGVGTSPEELIAAAHAACFSMALANALAEAGYAPKRVYTTANVTVEKSPEGFTITRSALAVEVEAPGIDRAEFEKHAEQAKSGCPVSRALAGVDITLQATLV